MLLKDSILEQSPYLQGFMKKALQQGLENGERKALLGVLDRLLTSRFVGVPVSAEVKRLETKKLQLLVDQLIAADGKEAAREILRVL